MKTFSSKLLLCSLLWSVSCAFPLKAQELSNPPSSNIQVSVSSPEDPAIPLAADDKFTVYLKRTYGTGALLKSGAMAGISQARNRPAEWGQGWNAYGARFRSSMGQRAVSNTISFGVGALRGEDPRYFPSGQTSTSARIGSALAQTFVVHTDHGGRTVAIGRIAGAFGGGFVSRTWQPGDHGIIRPGFQSGALSLASGAVSNVIREFWPGIKKHLHH